MYITLPWSYIWWSISKAETPNRCLPKESLTWVSSWVFSCVNVSRYNVGPKASPLPWIGKVRLNRFLFQPLFLFILCIIAQPIHTFFLSLGGRRWIQNIVNERGRDKWYLNVRAQQRAGVCVCARSKHTPQSSFSHSKALSLIRWLGWEGWSFAGDTARNKRAAILWTHTIAARGTYANTHTLTAPIEITKG